MKTNLNYLFVYALLLIVVSSCKKELVNPNDFESKLVNPSKIYKLPTTTAEKELVSNLEKITTVLKVLYADKNNLQEVNASIYAKVYTDQSILLKDLIYYEGNKLSYNNKSLQQCKNLSITPGNFSVNFWNQVQKMNDKSFSSFLGKINQNPAMQPSRRIEDLQNESEISIYEPYSENYNFTTDPIISVTTATADADEGWGSKSFYDGNGQIQWTQVLINDDYAYMNPTQIVGLNGVEAYNSSDQLLDPNPPIAPPGVNRVYIGEARCIHQYDHLISFTGNGGGSEIKFCRLSGYLQPINGQVSNFQDIASVNFSRGDIRNHRRLRKYIVWDSDWNPDNSEQVWLSMKKITPTQELLMDL